jgi:hypothetical protein
VHSNNSVACDDISQLHPEFWEGYRGNGEPYGLVNLPLARQAGRTADPDRDTDADVCGFNPCAEVLASTLPPFATCTLLLKDDTHASVAPHTASPRKLRNLLPCRDLPSQHRVRSRIAPRRRHPLPHLQAFACSQVPPRQHTAHRARQHAHGNNNPPPPSVTSCMLAFRLANSQGLFHVHRA